MITHQTLRRSLAVLVAGVALVLAAPAVAMADDPASWPKAPHVSGWQFLVVLFLIPAGLALVIALLAALPTIVKGDKGYQAGAPWTGGSAWLGGPKEGAEAAPADTDAEAGGASARW